MQPSSISAVAVQDHIALLTVLRFAFTESLLSATVGRCLGLRGAACSKADLDARFGRQGWCSSPRFMITQGSGKRRPIDDSRKARVSQATRYKTAMSAKVIVEELSTHYICCCRN